VQGCGALETAPRNKITKITSALAKKEGKSPVEAWAGQDWSAPGR